MPLIQTPPLADEPTAPATPTHIWACTLTLRDADGRALSGYGVATAPRATPALRRMMTLVRSHGLDGQGTVLGPLHNVELDEIHTLAETLTPKNDAAIGPLGYDDPRATDDDPQLASPLQYSALDDAEPFGPDTEDGPTQLLSLLFPEQPAQPGAARDQTYAILDAARVFGLAERITGSGLANACLFQGKAAVDYADEAPYVVRLALGNSFTKALFTDLPDDPIHAGLWSAGPGIFLRSPLNLDGVRKQFRSYTMVLDKPSGKMNYFRFYDPTTFRTILAHAPAETLKRFGRGTRLFAAPGPGKAAFLMGRQGL